MIARDAVPIGHKPVYKPIDIRGRRRTITREMIENNIVREPDPEAYEEVLPGQLWVLKE